MTKEKTIYDADVLIVGMGPTGAALAGLLGRYGVRVAVFDKLSGLYPLPRAAGMDHEVMRLAQELGIADALEPYVVPYRASEYRGVDGQVIKRLDSPPPPHRLGWDPMFAFDQPAFEGLLRDRVSGFESVTVSLECTVTAVGQDDDHVWVDTERPGSSPQRFTGRYLVGCDGGSSSVRRALGVTLTDLEFHENFLVVDAIVDVETLDRLPATHVQYCEPDRPATYVALAGRHRRWEIMLHPGELPVGPVSDGDAWPFVSRWISPGDATLWRSAAYTFHGLVADRWRKDRIFLAGDAAHMTPPFMAQGMAQGIRDAQNLAWKLRYVLSVPAAPQTVLDSYETERRPHVIATTGHTIDLGRVICERDEATARVRDAQLRGDTDEVPITYRSELLPPLSDGLIATGTPGAGEILPQPFVCSSLGHQRLDDVNGHGFRILLTRRASEADTAALRTAIAPLGGRVLTVLGPDLQQSETGADVVYERDGVLASWLSGLAATVVIARPDHRVYATAADIASALGLIGRLTESLGCAAGKSTVVAG